MAKYVSQFRATSTALADLLGKVGQLIVNTTRNSLHVMDEITPGGFELGRADASNIQEATLTQNGIMTSDHVASLTTNETGLTSEISSRIAGDTVLANDITTVAAAAAAAQSTANGKITIISPATVDRIAFMTAAGQLKDSGFPFFAEGSLLKFASALPTGWTLNTSFNDKVDLNTSTAEDVGDTGGSWEISGITGGVTGSHILTLSEIPAHSHTTTFTVSTATDDSFDGHADNGAGGTTGTVTCSVANAGGGGGHTHTGSTLTSDSVWRPAYVKTLWASRAAASA